MGPLSGHHDSDCHLRAQFDQALSTFFTADGAAHVLVASIPDLFQLWETVRTNVAAQVIWLLGLHKVSVRR